MAELQIVAGDDVAVLVTLKIEENGVPTTFNMVGATVTARIITEDHSGALTEEVAQSGSATGANYLASLVAIEMTKAQTAKIPFPGSGKMKGKIEIQVSMPETKTFYVPVDIVKGTIS